MASVDVPGHQAGAATRRDRRRRVKARLYPLTPGTKFLEFLVECLPRRLVDVVLHPARDLAPLGNGEFRSLGKNPSFEIRGTGPWAKGGWFYVEAALVRHTGNREALIHGRGGPPEHREFSCPVPSNLRGTIREVVFIPPGAERVYWSPMREPGFFSQSELLLHRISALEAWLRRAHRVILTWQQQSGGGNEALKLGKALANLQEAYLHTARMQIKRYRGHEYSTFLARRDQPPHGELGTMAARLRNGCDAAPTFSLVLRANSGMDPAHLVRTVESLRAQSFARWEAHIVVAQQDAPPVHDALSTLVRDEPRVRVLSTAEQAQSTHWLETALRHAAGKFVAVLHAADTLAPHALLLVADAISRHPDATLIYSDHDFVDAEGMRLNPQFKPDWNPDLLLACDYIGRACFFSAGQLRRIGAYREQFTPAEAYDLLLRFAFAAPAGSIVHVPGALYHQSLSGQSPPSSAEAMHDAALRAVQDALHAAGATASAGLVLNTYRVRHPIPSPPPLVSIIVPTRDKLPILRECVESLRRHTRYPNWELLVVDNASREAETLEWLSAVQRDARIRVLRDDRPFNYSALNNRAVREARGTVIVLLNNDVEILDSEWLDELVSHALRPGVGAVGAKLLYPNGMVQHAGVVLGIGGVAGHVHRYLGRDDPGYMSRAIVTQNLSVVTAACMAVRKSVYLEMGGLDEQDLRVAFNDVDFCLKLVRAGYRNVFTPFAVLNHHESLSRGHDDTPEKQIVFKHEFAVMKQRLGGFADPAYNPNLSLEFEDFSLRRN